jgi:cytochrome c peroxidase
MGVMPAFFWDGRQSTVEDAVNDALNHEMHPDFTADIKYLANNPQYSYLFKKAFGRPGDVTEDKIEKALSQFIRTLISANSRMDQYYRGEIQLTSAEAAGLHSITASTNAGDAPGTISDCFHCHTDGAFLTFVNLPILYQNNGLDSLPITDFTGFKDLGRGAITGDFRDNGKFKIPTLRNVAVSAPYMHDGRFATLDQVIGHYSDSLKNSPNINIANLQFIDSGGAHMNAATKANLLAFLNALTDTSFLNNPAFSNPFH